MIVDRLSADRRQHAITAAAQRARHHLAEPLFRNAYALILAELLTYVIEDPARNTREALLAQAQQLELAVAHDDDND